jgi:hypothetical protein
VIDPLAKIKLRPKTVSYPQSPIEDLPREFFVSLFVGSRGSGKTFSACHLLRMYEKHGLWFEGTRVPMRVIVFSPTYTANKPFFDCLREVFDPVHDLYEAYDEDTMHALHVSLNKEKRESVDYLDKLDAWKQALRAKNLEDLPFEIQLELNAMGWIAPQPPKYPYGRANFLLMDDMIGSSAYKQGKSEFTSFLLRCRHLQTNVLCMVQNMKSVPKAVRQNASVFVLFRNANAKVVAEDLYDEVSASYTLPQFQALYQYAIDSDQHACLVIDTTQPRERQLKIGWSIVLHPGDRLMEKTEVHM